MAPEASSPSSLSSPSPSPSASGPEVALLFIGVSLALGAASRQLLRNTRVPYTVALLLIGVALGALEYEESANIGKLGESIRMWSNIDPDLILYVFLPALLFESSFSLEFHQIKRCMLQMFLLAGPGVCISTISLGLVDKYILPYDWNWPTSLLLGGLLSATDPVAVVALLRDLGASKKLSTIIEGESLMNDGSAIVVFQLFLKITLGQKMSAGEIVSFLSQVTLGAIAMGLAFGFAGVIWLRTVFNDYVIEITLTFTASYMGFFVANGVTDMSGVLTVLTLGIVFGVFAKTALTGESEHSMHHFWEMIAYIANTLIFTLSGVVIAESILRSGSLIQGRDWAYLVVLYIFVQLSRLLVVALLYPGLAVSGYGLDWKEATVLVWSGLRGAVALSLALVINHEHDYEHISEVTAARMQFLTGGVVFLTLIVNGSTTQFLLGALKMNTTSDTKKRILEYTRHEMYDHALTTFQEVQEDEELGPAHWPTVRKYVHCLNKPPQPRDEDGHHASLELHTWEQLREQQIQDVRLRFLNGIQAAFWTMLEESRITQTAALLLMQAVAESIDVATRHQKLDVWCGVEPHVSLPTYLKFMRKYFSWLPDRFFSWLTVGRLELATSMAAAFLRAQRHARKQLKDFMGTSEVANIVRKESLEQDAEAKKFLEDVRVTFPEVLRIIKTKQVTHAILTELTDYVKGLERAGLLDTKETNHLHDAVEADLKSLMRRPPRVDMPTPGEILGSQPLFMGISKEAQAFLEYGAKRDTKLSGSTLTKKGYTADGIWLIASGTLLWTMESMEEKDGKETREPMVVQGGVLGLYEVLAGEPYMCTVVADSVINCFFIERSKVISAAQTSPEVTSFMWKESALLVAKVILEEELGGFSLWDLRTLIGQTGRLEEHRRGTSFGVQIHEVALLLEGEVLLGEDGPPWTPPCVLRCTPTEKNVNALITSANYLCTKLCRILFFDLFESQRLETMEEGSEGGNSGRYTMGERKGSHDHDGLLRWKQDDEEDEEAMAERALKSGILGSGILGSGVLQSSDGIMVSGKAGSSVRERGYSSEMKRTKSKTSLMGNAKARLLAQRYSPSGTSNKDMGRSNSHPILIGSESREGERLIQDGGHDHDVKGKEKKAEGTVGVNGKKGEGHLLHSDSDDDEHVVHIDSPSHLFPGSS